MSELYIHAWDPGGTTGYALLYTDGGAKPNLLHTASMVGVEDFERMLGLTTATTAPTVFVAEEFKLYPGSAQKLVWNNMIAARRLGTVEMIAAHLGVPIYLQSPSIMRMFNNKTLRERVDLSLCDLPKIIHEQDALRHAAYFYYNHLMEKKDLWTLPNSQSTGR